MSEEIIKKLKEILDTGTEGSMPRGLKGQLLSLLCEVPWLNKGMPKIDEKAMMAGLEEGRDLLDLLLIAKVLTLLRSVQKDCPDWADFMSATKIEKDKRVIIMEKTATMETEESAAKQTAPSSDTLQ